MTNALIELNGKQYTVKLGGEVIVDDFHKKEGEKIEIDKVLLWEEEGNTKVGQPYVPGVLVIAEVVKNFKGPKIDVKKYKSKVRYRRKTGFRSHLTALRIIKLGSQELKVKTEIKKTPVVKEKKTSKTETKPKSKK